MKAEAEAHAADDKKTKEEIEKINAADSMIFQSEKNLKDYGDKLPADKKSNIENALNELKAAHSARNVAGIDQAMEKINNAWQAASPEMYQVQQSGSADGSSAGFNPNMGGAGFQGGNPGANQQGSKSNNDTVEDADYEEVK